MYAMEPALLHSAQHSNHAGMAEHTHHSEPQAFRAAGGAGRARAPPRPAARTARRPRPRSSPAPLVARHSTPAPNAFWSLETANSQPRRSVEAHRAGAQRTEPPRPPCLACSPPPSPAAEAPEAGRERRRAPSSCARSHLPRRGVAWRPARGCWACRAHVAETELAPGGHQGKSQTTRTTVCQTSARGAEMSSLRRCGILG